MADKNSDKELEEIKAALKKARAQLEELKDTGIESRLIEVVVDALVKDGGYSLVGEYPSHATFKHKAKHNHREMSVAVAFGILEELFERSTKITIRNRKILKHPDEDVEEGMLMIETLKQVRPLYITMDFRQEISVVNIDRSLKPL